MREKKREMKFQAKQSQSLNNSVSNFVENNDAGNTTTDEETEEEGTSGNTGKPRKTRPMQTMNSNHGSAAVPGDSLKIAVSMGRMFEAELLTDEVSKGRGGSTGHRFRCANGHEFTTSFEKLRIFSEMKEPTHQKAKDLWCVKCAHFHQRC